MSGITPDAVISAASSQVGFHEGRFDGHWNNHQPYSDQVPGLAWSQDQPWCCTFVSWCGLKAGAGSYFPLTASCSAAVAWWRKAGRWSEYPAVGAQVFYGPGGGTHTGIVERWDADHIYTIEGNTNVNGSAEGDGVYRRVRLRRDPYVYGYGYPKYPGGIDSADPAWTDQLRPAVKPGPRLQPFPGANWAHSAPHSPIVTAMGKRLEAVGCSAYTRGPGPQWTEADRASYRLWQLKLGYRGGDADGWPGVVSWGRLEVPHV